MSRNEKKGQELTPVNWGIGQHLTEEEITIVQKYGTVKLTIGGVEIKAMRDYEPKAIATSIHSTKFEAWYDDFVCRILPELGYYYMTRFIDCGFEPFLFLQVLEQEGKLKRE